VFGSLSLLPFILVVTLQSACHSEHNSQTIPIVNNYAELRLVLFLEEDSVTFAAKEIGPLLKRQNTDSKAEFVQVEGSHLQSVIQKLREAGFEKEESRQLSSKYDDIHNIAPPRFKIRLETSIGTRECTFLYEQDKQVPKKYRLLIEPLVPKNRSRIFDLFMSLNRAWDS
jgi:hypothetical protein